MSISTLRVIRRMFTTKVLKCDPSSIVFGRDADQPEIRCPETLSSLTQAAQQLKLPRCVAFPTETVYGLGALALDASASSQIFSAKGRPPDNPLIVHVSSFPMLQSILPPGFILPSSYKALMTHFWPGALTLLFPSDPNIVPSIITAGQPTVAIRMPSHPVARALIAIADAPIAAPSANSSGKPSPTKADHVARDLHGKIPLILDGGACGVGLESTVLDGMNPDGDLRILRPGGVTVEDIEQVLRDDFGTTSRVPRVLVHRRDFHDETMETTPTTPGMKYRHYSPSVPVSLLLTISTPPEEIRPLDFSSYITCLRDERVEPTRPLKIGLLFPSDSSISSRTNSFDGVEWYSYPLGRTDDLASIGQHLFDGLLTLEREGVDVILIEEVPEDKEGLAIMNRVRKAAGETRWISV